MDSSDGVSFLSKPTRSSHPSAAGGGRRWPATTSGGKADVGLRRPTGAPTDCGRAADDGGRHLGLRSGRGIDDQGQASGVAVARVSTIVWSTVGAQLDHSWTTVGPCILRDIRVRVENQYFYVRVAVSWTSIIHRKIRGPTVVQLWSNCGPTAAAASSAAAAAAAAFAVNCLIPAARFQI